MRRRGLRGMTAALVIGLGAAVTTANGGEYDGNPPETRGLLSGMFHEKPRSHGKSEKKGGDEPQAQPGGTVAAVEVERQRRENALFRRMQVCDRLRTIANQTGNEALMNQADELEDRANAIYRQQTSGLPLPAQAPLSVLAADNESSTRPNGPLAASRDKTNAAAENLSLPQRPVRSINSTAGLGGSLDQREQAILNGKSMGGN